MFQQSFPALVVGAVIGIVLNFILSSFISNANPQPEILWLIIARIIPILGSFATFFTVLSTSEKL